MERDMVGGREEAMPSDDAVRVTAQLVGGPDDGTEDLEAGAQQVALEAAQFAETRPLLAGAAPSGTRTGPLETVGAVVLAIEPLLPSILAIVELLLTWASERPGRTVRITEADGSELDLAGLSADDQRRLALAWIERKNSG
jgi:hypothetical protein